MRYAVKVFGDSKVIGLKMYDTLEEAKVYRDNINKLSTLTAVLYKIELIPVEEE